MEFDFVQESPGKAELLPHRPANLQMIVLKTQTLLWENIKLIIRNNFLQMNFQIVRAGVYSVLNHYFSPLKGRLFIKLSQLISGAFIRPDTFVVVYFILFYFCQRYLIKYCRCKTVCYQIVTVSSPKIISFFCKSKHFRGAYPLPRVCVCVTTVTVRVFTYTYTLIQFIINYMAVDY